MTTIRRSLDEVLELRRRGYSGVDSERVKAMTPEEIERLADEDDKRLGINADEWGAAHRVNGISNDRQETSS